MHRVSSFVPLVLALLLAAIYAGGLQGELVWDDPYIVHRAEHREWTGALAAWSKPFILNPEEARVPYYRPLSSLTYFLDYRVWGGRPFGYRLENLLLHGLAVLLLYRLVLKASGDPWTAAFSAALFASHPVNAEAVSFISARGDLLAAALVLASLLCLRRAADGDRIGWTAALLSYALALFSKESAAGLPWFLAAAAFTARPGQRRFLWQAAAACAAVTVGYLLVRAAVLGGFASGLPVPGAAERAGLVAASFAWFLRLLFYPAGLSAIYPFQPFAFLSAGTLAAASCAALLTALALRRAPPRPLQISAAWVLAFFLPVSNLVPIPTTPVADRFLYAPLLGLCAGLGWALRTLHRRRPVWGIAVFAAAVALLAVLAHGRSEVWRTSIALWEDAAAKAPRSLRVRNNLANTYMARGTPERATEHHEAALVLAEEAGGAETFARSEIHYNLGLAYQKRGMPGEALRHYQAALALHPDKTDALNNLGTLYFAEGAVDRAIAAYRRAVAVNSGYLPARLNLAEAYLARGEPARAVEECEVYVAARPEDAEGRYRLGQALEAVGAVDRAAEEYRRALSLAPGLSGARARLTALLAHPAGQPKNPPAE